MADHELDARRLLCPLPVIRLQNFVTSMAPGDTVEIVCTDPGSQSDIPAWCRVHGHTLLAQCQDGDDYLFTVKKQ